MLAHRSWGFTSRASVGGLGLLAGLADLQPSVNVDGLEALSD